MAVIYLRSGDGSDASDGLTWANAKATLAAALTAAGAGGTVYVSDNHAETQASAMTLTSPGTAASPTVVLCVDDTADPEPPTALATTATVSTTGASSFTFNGFAYCYGITFSAGSAANTANLAWASTSPWAWFFDTCHFKLANTSASSLIAVGTITDGGSDDQIIHWNNCSVEFGSTSQSIRAATRLVWTNKSSAIVGATIPTTLIIGVNNAFCDVTVRGVDLSALGSGNNLVSVASSEPGRFLLENCKLGDSVTVATGTHIGQGGFTIDLINCDSADTNYRYHRVSYQGNITQEATIVRTSGASDGTTAISRKMVSSANSKFYSPLESAPIIRWNETTGSSVTATVEVVTDNVTLTDAEAWVEVEYLGTSGFPLSLFVSDRAADYLATPANQTTSSVAWTTTGLTTPVKQKFSVSFTPQEKGLIKARVMLAKASTTMYFCPLLDIS